MSNDIRKAINIIKRLNEEEDKRKWVECPRCGGSGELEVFRHIQGGRCFECGGKGVVPNDKVPEIVAKMKQEYVKRQEKKKEAQKAMQDKNTEEWNSRYEFAVDFNTKLLEKVILPVISTEKLLANKQFDGLVRMAEYQKANNTEGFVDSAEGFLKIMKDFGFSWELFYRMEIAKYLQERYNYNPLDYLKAKEDLKDFYLFQNRDMKSNLPEKTIQTIQALIEKYRPAYEDIGMQH